jgi:hypothetical protein
VSEPTQSAASQDQLDGAGAGEALDALPVLADGPYVVQAQQAAGALTGDWRSAGTAVQAAAVAAGGFVAGAAVVGLVHRRQHRSTALSKGKRARKGGKAGELVQIVGSRSFLVDVHLLGGPGGNR